MMLQTKDGDAISVFLGYELAKDVEFANTRRDFFRLSWPWPGFHHPH